MSADNVIVQPVHGGETVGTDDIGPITRAKYALVRGFLWAWARCFSLKGLYLFGLFFGTCEYIINHKRRRRFREKLDYYLASHVHQLDQSISKITWRYFMRIRCDKLFYLIFDKLPREKILRRIKFHNREILDQSLELGRGAYVCLSHNGSHHVCGLLMALMDYRVAGVRDRNEAPLRRYVQEKYEETFPEFRAIRVFFADSYPRDLYRCFREGYILGSALDIGRSRGEHLRTATVNMCGEEREFLTGTLQIALRCGAPVLQGFVVSSKNFYFHLIVQGPLADPATATDEPAVVQNVMQRYADNIAAHLKKYPDHISKP